MLIVINISCKTVWLEYLAVAEYLLGNSNYVVSVLSSTAIP